MERSAKIPIGTAVSHEWTVTPEVTVAAHGSVPLDVLATPHLIFMLEDTCVLAVAPSLPEGRLTVGTEVHVRHLAAALVGERVVAHAELADVDGQELSFKIEARCGDRVIARGTHRRHVVDAERFMSRRRTETGALNV